MTPRTVLLATVLALLASLAVVPVAAAATACSVRAAALTPAFDMTTTVSVPSSGYVVDSFGSHSSYTFPNALAALGVAAHKAGYGFVTTGAPSVDNAFVNSIAWMGGPPDWTSWWLYSVDGYYPPDIATGDLRLVKGDRVTFFEVPGTAPFDSVYFDLVVRAAPARPMPGDNVTFTVVADDLTKPNSVAAASRFKVGAATVQTPAEFEPVANATLHVGAAIYTADATGQVVVPAVEAGTLRAWAEKSLEGSTVYVRSRARLVNAGVAPELTHVVARPNPFTPGINRVTVAFDLSKSATVKLGVRNRAGVLVATVKAWRNTGLTGDRRTLLWNGRTSTGRLVGPGVYSLRLTATDPWGRVAKAVATSVTAR